MSERASILIVEDDPVLKNLLGHTFGERFQTLYASDGGIALTLLQTQKPALVLLDLMLPGDIDGFGVLEAIRKGPEEEARLPVVIVSNLSDEAGKARAVSLGVSEYLVKAEVSVEEIVACIEHLLSSPSQSA